MCGIVGYIGEKKASKIILDGLQSLEYRGYDSAGIAISNNKTLNVYKELGELTELKKSLKNVDTSGSIAIGHTRWATHGEPLKINAHPHFSKSKKFAIVHNGIIENYIELTKMLKTKHKISFRSNTDSEVIAHLIEINYKGDLLNSVKKTVQILKGAYAFAVISNEGKEIIAVRKDAPLVVGETKNDGNYLASDIPAILNFTRKIYFLDNNEIVRLTKNSIEIFDENLKKINRKVNNISWDYETSKKDGYEHFMLKEIFEQPKGVLDTLSRRLSKNNGINLDGIKMSDAFVKKIDKVVISSCGTAYHAGLVGKNLIEKFAKIPTEVEVASEFRYKDPIISDKTLFISISQSGETLDTLEALREAKRKKARVLSIVNVVGSSIARESDDVFYTFAGPEISVASTKAYTTQLICLYLIALFLGNKTKRISKKESLRIIGELKSVPEKISVILKGKKNIETLAKKIYKANNIMFIGRGLDASTSYEASLKLKEISYINSFAIQAGELKHGTIALVDNKQYVFTLATQEFLIEKIISNAKEILARKGTVIPIVKEKNKKLFKNISDFMITIPNCDDIDAPLLSIVPLQLLAYYIAKNRGENIDKPKNLAKSVTVE